uniref:G-protein coupled receptors family 3 profile domain-containing protein n=1 Tax=Xenopus tropicalis TaxID=8364 RepID=A0A6I8SUY1_XENTR
DPFCRPRLFLSPVVSIQHYQTMQALIFAVEEINADSDLLPNITLGFQMFETCITIRRAAQGTLSLLSGGNGITPNYYCYSGAPLAGVIGDSASPRSIIMAQILGLYRYPQISYYSTSPILSKRDLFPSFFRTIPSDEFQMRGLAQMVTHFGWSWVGILANDDDYGQFGLQVAKQELMNVGVCVAFSETILTGQSNTNAPHIVQVIRESSAKVVIVIATDHKFIVVVEELFKQNVTGTIWVASEGWATSTLLSDKRFQIILKGTIGSAIHSGHLPKFADYLNSLRPSTYPGDSYMMEFWEKVFTCKWLGQENIPIRVDNATFEVCTGNEKLESLLTQQDPRLSLNIYTAVYALAWALHSLIYCTPGTGPFHYGTCANMSSLHQWQLLHYVKNVNFKTKDGTHIFFDANGNPPAIYDIVNWRLNAKGGLEQVTVGSYTLEHTDSKTLQIVSNGIIWPNNNTEVPISRCSPSCPSGFRKMIVPGKPPCCYENVCEYCSPDAAECHPCSWDTWPNLQQDRCLPRPTEFLSYGDPLGYSLAAISILSSLIPLTIFGIFIRFKKTPIVRANNYSLSCLLLLSLFLCFLCSLGFIGYPQPEKCLLRQVAFGMVFALCISCVLAKTITVVIAFNATKPGSRLRKWTGVKVSYCFIAFCLFFQLFLCIMWLIFSPPFTELDTITYPGVIIVNCNEGSPTAFWCMLGYLGLLASISFIVAFLARRLPDSFNEAKLITFSMLAFLSVWVSFIPAYLSARGMYTVAMEVFAILSSSWAVVGCIFVPKCYIVLFRPNMNSREHLTVKSKVQK